MCSTIKQAILETLDNLIREDFLRFCAQLRDRREAPRVSVRAVENKTQWQVADVLVSTYTETKALQVALDLLRQMNKNEEAQTLELKTKVFVEKGDPHFRRTSTGMLDLKPSEEALKLVPRRPLQAAQPTGPLVQKPGEGMAEAKACVLPKGRDLCNETLLLSKCTLQFGQYRGQTFKWLLENDVKYAVFVVAGHQREKKSGDQQDNKDSLTKYAKAFPEVMEEVRFHCAYMEAEERSRLKGPGEALVGFGAHRWETLRNLYESSDTEKLSYVNWLRTMKSTCTRGSKMEIAIWYILQRDQEQDGGPSGASAEEGHPYTIHTRPLTYTTDPTD